MTSDIILKYYWNIFLAHICEFYPLDKAFMEEFEYELNWHSISKNRNIDWDIEFLKRYENRFIWHELAWNESITWTEDKIDTFKKRLDWYYLGRNTNLPITEEFILKYIKKLFVVETNPLLNEALIGKYNIKVLPANHHDTQEIKSISDNEVENILTTFTFHHNQKELYERVFLSIIQESSLNNIFSNKFDYSQRYYYLEPLQHDVHGLTPEFEIEGPNPFKDYREGRGLFEVDNEIVLINGSLQEGPARLYEVPRFQRSFFTTMLVSEHVKSVLDQFKLPGLIYHPVTLRPKKITTSTKYFILHMEYDTLVKDLDYRLQEFYFTIKSFKVRGYGKVTDQINNYDDYVNATTALNKQRPDVSTTMTIFPNNFKLLSDFDIYSYSYQGKIIVNQYVKDALEKYLPGQMEFTSAQLLNISIDQEAYDNKAKQIINTKLKSGLNYQESPDDQYYYQKAERLERDDPPLDPAILESDSFSKKEIELNVVFPKIFKNNFIRKNLHIEGYELLPVSKFHVENGFADRNPETYKSVVIGVNGIGDSINLILQRDSDHKLQYRIFEFLHETGEYQEI